MCMHKLQKFGLEHVHSSPWCHLWANKVSKWKQFMETGNMNTSLYGYKTLKTKCLHFRLQQKCKKVFPLADPAWLGRNRKELRAD